MNEIVSNKLSLIPMNLTDWGTYVTHVVEAEELFIQYGIEPSDYLIECIQEPTENVLYYSIVPKDTGKMVGYIGITPENNNIEFYIFKEYRKQGFGAEAISAFTKAYLDGTVTGKIEEDVVAETLSDNSASIALLEKLGYQRQAVGIRMDFSDLDKAAIGLCVYSYANVNS